MFKTYHVYTLNYGKWFLENSYEALTEAKEKANEFIEYGYETYEVKIVNNIGMELNF